MFSKAGKETKVPTDGSYEIVYTCLLYTSRGEKETGVFHQWFGDYASCESWSNLTLNESFATYGEYLWEEFANGRDAADDHSAQSRFGYFAQSAQKQVDLVRFDYDAVSYTHL